MIHYLKNIIWLPWFYGMLVRNLRIQKIFLKKSIVLDIEVSKKHNDNSLNNKDYAKIKDYYALAVPAILGECFCILRNRKMTPIERHIITYLGGLSGLLDDFFDNTNTSDQYIENLILHPLEQNGKNSFEILLIKLYNKALEKSSNSTRIKKSAIKVYEAQKISKTQTSTDISRDEIEHITYQKGGVSFQFYRNAFDNDMTTEESVLIYKLGAIMQLENDIFDVYKDLKEGIKTLVTTEKNIDNIRKKYVVLFDELKFAAFKTNYADTNIKQFLRIVSLVLCRAFVCLDMLEKNEKKTNNIFSPALYKRKDLICDMEKPANFIKSIHYYAKLNSAGR